MFIKSKKRWPPFKKHILSKNIFFDGPVAVTNYEHDDMIIIWEDRVFFPT